MVTLDAVVRILLRVVKRARGEVRDRVVERGGAVGDDLVRFAMREQRRGEELSGCGDVAAGRDIHVDDLAVVVNGAVDVAPHTGDFYVSFVDEPPAAYRVPARLGRVDHDCREAVAR